jgi:hypothetical protein
MGDKQRYANDNKRGNAGILWLSKIISVINFTIPATNSYKAYDHTPTQ